MQPYICDLKNNCFIANLIHIHMILLLCYMLILLMESHHCPDRSTIHKIGVISWVDMLSCEVWRLSFIARPLIFSKLCHTFWWINQHSNIYHQCYKRTPVLGTTQIIRLIVRWVLHKSEMSLMLWGVYSLRATDWLT